MPVGTVLASAAVAAPIIILPYLEHVVSPCFDDCDTAAMMCTALVPELADGPERATSNPGRASAGVLPAPAKNLQTWAAFPGSSF